MRLLRQEKNNLWYHIAVIMCGNINSHRYEKYTNVQIMHAKFSQRIGIGLEYWLPVKRRNLGNMELIKWRWSDGELRNKLKNNEYKTNRTVTNFEDFPFFVF